MAAFLVDESCPRAVATALQSIGHDVRYAADTDRRASDDELLQIAHLEGRVIVTEDFDFGELLVRERRPSYGAIVLNLPGSSPQERAASLVETLASQDFECVGRLTIISRRRIRQRIL